MPEHNLIQRPDLIHRLQQFLGVRQAHIVPTLSEHVSPVVIIGDVRDEELTPEVESKPGFGSIVQGGGPATNARCALYNPAGSGVNVEVTRVEVVNDTAGILNARVALEFAGTMAADIPGVFRNSQLADPNQTGTVLAGLTVARLTSEATAVIPADMWHLALPIQSVAEFTEPVVLGPGWRLIVADQAVNQQLTVNFSWEESQRSQRR